MGNNESAVANDAVSTQRVNTHIANQVQIIDTSSTASILHTGQESLSINLVEENQDLSDADPWDDVSWTFYKEEIFDDGNCL